MTIGNKDIEMVGGKEVIYSTGIIVRNNDEAHIAFIYENERISLGIRLKREDKNEENSSRIEAEVVDNKLVWTFVNWDNPLGTATIEPIEIAKLNDGRSISLMVVCWSIEEISKMNFQFLI